MRNIIIAVLLIVAMPIWASTEYRRPTADADSTNGLLLIACGISSGAKTNIASYSQSAAYSGKTGVGPTGSSAFLLLASSSSSEEYTARVFKNWATGSAYSLVLYLSMSCDIEEDGNRDGGLCGAAYSTDGGSTWTGLYQFSSSQTNSDNQAFYTATITGTSLANLQVGICSETDSGVGGNSAQTNTYDIWTSGTPSTSSGFDPGTFEDGALHWPWWDEEAVFPWRYSLGDRTALQGSQSYNQNPSANWLD